MFRAAAAGFSALLLLSCNAMESRTHASSNSASSNSAATGTETKPVAGRIAPQGNTVSYADTVDHVAPAVVTVHSARRVRAPQQYQFQRDPFFDWFFGGGGGGGGQQRFGGGRAPEQRQAALGSGVVVRADGYILTNDHVVDGAEEISVDLTDRRSLKAKLVGADKPSDLAVLKVDAGNLPVLSPGNSDEVRVGDVCLAVGNPLGIGETVTAGIISAKGRHTDLSDGSFEDFLQTDAPINQGNSGGALVNTRGELIGINSQIVSSNGGNIGIGFAIPSNMAKTVMTQLIEHGKVSRGQLGVTVQYITADLAASLGLKETKGVLVNNVRSGGPADRAGVKSGDVILELNGKPVDDVNTLRNQVAAAGAGTNATLTLLRNGNRQQAQVKLGEFSPNATGPDQNGGGNGNQDTSPAGRLGLNLAPDPQGLAVASLDPNGPAAQAGVREGDIIQQVNRQAVHNGNDVQSALAKSGDRPVLLQVLRGGQTLFLAVRLK